MTEDYKILEINGVKYFPENAVHMLIDEAKKLIKPNKHTDSFEDAKRESAEYASHCRDTNADLMARLKPSQNSGVWGKSRIDTNEYRNEQRKKNAELKAEVDSILTQNSFISNDLPRDRPGIHQNDDGSKTFDYVTTEGDPCKIKIEAGWDGKIVDGILQVFQAKTSEDK